MNILKQYLVKFLVALLAFQGVVAAEILTIQPAQAAVNDVIINEVMWTGTQANSGDEWIELYNNTSINQPIAGWSLTNVLTSNGTYVFTPEVTIAPHGYYLIGHDSTPTARTVPLDQSISNFTLPTTCSVINLIDSNANLVDKMGCSGTNHYYPSSPTTRHALERNVAIGPGDDISNWHERIIGSAHINNVLYPATLASPKAININDTTAPITGSATATPANYFDHVTRLRAAWQGFTDPDSGLESYQVGLGDNSANPNTVGFQPVSTDKTSLVLTLPDNLTENQAYYVLVTATNPFGLTSPVVASSPVVFRETTPPDSFSLTSAIDTPSDNGGSINVAWLASSTDVTNYQVQSQPHGGSWLSPQTKDVGLNLTATITGLQNAPASYDVRVLATSFNGTSALSSNVLTAQAADNLAPMLDSTKLVVGQNNPGTTDTLTGLSGLSNEPNITANVYFENPAAGSPTPTVVNINSVGGFTAALNIGDNLHSQIWVRLFDGSNFSALTAVVTNDIVGPTAPVLTKATTNCDNDNCRVNLDWQAGSADTASYKVNYVVDGVTHTTFAVTTNKLTLDLPSGKTYQLSVTGFDQFGNPSPISNLFSLALTKGVITSIELVNGSPKTTTTAISGATEVSTKEVPPAAKPAEFVPKAQAAAPITTPDNSPTATETPMTQAATTNHDWIRIFVVVVLLLIIGGSFYALSRSVQPTPEETLKQNNHDQSELRSSDNRPRHRPRRRGRR